MQILLNTVMLEVNRWTADHQLTIPLIDLLPALKEAGFDALEIWQYHVSPMDRPEFDGLLARLTELGMETHILGVYPLLHQTGPEGKEAASQAARMVEYAARLRADIVKIFAGRVASADADEACWERSLTRLRDIAERAADHGMLLTVETHGTTLADTVESAARLLHEMSDVGNLAICYQPYNFQDTDAALSEFDAVAQHVKHVHLQNHDEKGNCRLTEGFLDYRRLLPHIKRSGFDGPLSLEFTTGIFPAEGETFQAQVVIDNAAKDRDFVIEVWG